MTTIFTQELREVLPLQAVGPHGFDARLAPVGGDLDPDHPTVKMAQDKSSFEAAHARNNQADKRANAKVGFVNAQRAIANSRRPVGEYRSGFSSTQTKEIDKIIGRSAGFRRRADTRNAMQPTAQQPAKGWTATQARAHATTKRELDNAPKESEISISLAQLSPARRMDIARSAIESGSSVPEGVKAEAAFLLANAPRGRRATANYRQALAPKIDLPNLAPTPQPKPRVAQPAAPQPAARRSPQVVASRAGLRSPRLKQVVARRPQPRNWAGMMGMIAPTGPVMM